MTTKFLLSGILSFLFLTTSVLAQPTGFGNHPYNGKNPATKDGVTVFHVQEGDCSAVDYGDGRGESDCYNGNLRSHIRFNKHARLGDSFVYSFEIFIPEGFNYGGGPNRRSLLEVVELGRIRGIKNHLYTFHLDARRGLTFGDIVCITPSDLNKWNAVKLSVLWSMEEDGKLLLECNERLVVDRAGMNAIPPDCGEPGVFQCVPELQRPNEPIYFLAGILFRGYGERGRKDRLSKAGRLPPPEGFTVQLRNLSVKRKKFP